LTLPIIKPRAWLELDPEILTPIRPTLPKRGLYVEAQFQMEQIGFSNPQLSTLPRSDSNSTRQLNRKTFNILYRSLIQIKNGIVLL
jgi:hypothetical protein